MMFYNSVHSSARWRLFARRQAALLILMEACVASAARWSGLAGESIRLRAPMDRNFRTLFLYNLALDHEVSTTARHAAARRRGCEGDGFLGDDDGRRGNQESACGRTPSRQGNANTTGRFA